MPVDKTCSVCKTTKDMSNFSRRSRSKDGLMAACKACCADRSKNDTNRSERHKRYVEDNRERLNEQRRTRYAKDPSKKQAQNAEWRKNNPDKVREANRRSQLRKYGLTSVDYARMVEEQGGKCLICDQEPPPRNGKPEPLAVDHCHEIGIVRGLLCWRCNGAIGIIGESNIERAVSYLSRSRPNLEK